MKLYAVSQRIEELSEQMVDIETGEINEEIFAELTELVEEKEDRLESIFLHIKNLASDITALKVERDSFDKRIKRKTREMDRLLDWTTMLQKGKTFETDKVRVKYSLLMKSGSYEKAKFQELSEFIKQVSGAYGQKMVLKKK